MGKGMCNSFEMNWEQMCMNDKGNWVYIRGRVFVVRSYRITHSFFLSFLLE